MQQMQWKLSVAPGVRPIIDWIDRCRWWIYDRQHRVETSGKTGLGDLTVASSNVAFGNNFQPTPPRTVRVLLRQLQIRHSDYGFVDFGSGKGGVLLVAAEYPFLEVIGVEFAEELHKTAERNIRQYRGVRLCQSVRSVHCDAVHFDFPLEPLVLYFFNPFHRRVMEQVLLNLVRSHQMSPRDIFLLYQAPHYPKDLVLATEGVLLFQQTDYFDIYRIPA
jgi:Histone methylation protein DOT1